MTPQNRFVSPFQILYIFVSNPLFVFGLIFLIVGIFSSITFFSYFTSFYEFYLSGSEIAPIQVNALITDRERTSITINDRDVIKYTVNYYVEGKPYTSTIASHSDDLRGTQSVIVSVRPDKPEVIVLGTTLGEGFDFSLLFLLIFPSIGFIIAYFSARRSYGFIQLYKYGTISQAILTKLSPSKLRINNIPVMNMEFRTLDGNGTITVKEHVPMLGTSASHQYLNLPNTEVQRRTKDLSSDPEIQSTHFKIIHNGKSSAVLGANQLLDIDEQGAVQIPMKQFSSRAKFLFIVLGMFLLGFIWILVEAFLHDSLL
ncbi:hypothetical protein KC717_03760 [Candidatus Dojkabacteria bacterium]|uniref:DUF3592 domain-containing protein n=1 Tax=Candidatus Dojkabacteria bacterium TaxID=2099670 RepID=A0A955RKU0_9BACT|nr:hypothetical protein [Candidatus Dojkabacteria bacterium]